MDTFDESKHPRDKVGKFTFSDGRGGTHAATPAERKRLCEIGVDDGSQPNGRERAKITPTKREWAIWYERIAQISNLDYFVRQTSAGELLIPIETDNRCVLMITGGTFEKPILQDAFSFKNKDELDDFLKGAEL